MPNRLLGFIVGSAMAATAVLLTPGQLLLAQAARTTAPAAGARTADGHPDLQGIYDVATITPLERPSGIDKLVLSDQEAAALEVYEEQRRVTDNAPSDPNRGAPPVGGQITPPKSFLEFLENAGGGAVGGYNRFWLAGGTKVVTVNGEKRSSLIVDPPNGRMPPMKPEARQRNMAARQRSVAPDAAESAAAGPAGAFDDPELRPLAERCILGFGSTAGPPSLPNYFYNNLKQIVQTKDHILILNEMVHDARIVRMNQPHLPPHVKRWMGDSVGRWEGDTLVVDTTNFTSKTQFNGSGENLHVIERFTKLPDGNLLYRFTVEDPTTWERPWTGEYPWVRSNEQIYEYACHEGNYSLEGILRGARMAEKDAAAKR